MDRPGREYVDYLIIRVDLTKVTRRLATFCLCFNTVLVTTDEQFRAAVLDLLGSGHQPGLIVHRGPRGFAIQIIRMLDVVETPF